ncbi:MAG TPA: hypothetical protein PKX92_02115 [Edaphocola sp.]|nr:hypothetical protein [Edaphocola sp.]
MKNLINLLLIAFLCLLCRTVLAQSLPPVNFPQKNICDTTSLKLVLYDDFDGNKYSTLFVCRNQREDGFFLQIKG